MYRPPNSDLTAAARGHSSPPRNQWPVEDVDKAVPAADVGLHHCRAANLHDAVHILQGAGHLHGQRLVGQRPHLALPVCGDELGDAPPAADHVMPQEASPLLVPELVPGGREDQIHRAVVGAEEREGALLGELLDDRGAPVQVHAEGAQLLHAVRVVDHRLPDGPLLGPEPGELVELGPRDVVLPAVQHGALVRLRDPDLVEQDGPNPRPRRRHRAME
mmetsp:Transcript_15622/g.34271  ORF Transcript_15622/g.34271 Transcript_15622/m.34271 type:complete len:218 (+) Transcript_15622:3-656(+)